jgi:site-specific recombinase XerD
MNTLKNTTPYEKSSNLLCRTLEPAPVAGFSLPNANSVKTVPTMYYYRKPELKRHKNGWYVEYYYRIPEELKVVNKGKVWKRFRVKDDINRRKGFAREEYADYVLTTLAASLKNGFNPFGESTGLVAQNEPTPDILTAENAFSLFIQAWEKRGLEPNSLAKYKKCVNRLSKYLHKKHLLYTDVKLITIAHIEDFLNDCRTEYKKFSNREYNNTFDFIRTCFNYLLKKEIISKSPCAGIDKLKTPSTKHRYYDKVTLDKISAILQLKDPYVWFACQITYYACIRSDKELMNIRVGNINFDDNKIYLTADGAKGNRGRYVPMDENLKKLFIGRGIDKADPSFYLLGIDGKPSIKSFGTGFFSKRFRKVRDAAGINKVYTVYSFKFTRVVHLKQDGLDDSSIMALTGHTDFTAYAGYLRNLGLEASPDRINKVSRKV